MEKVLLHACCGICSGQPIKHLETIGYEVVVYFSNNNLDTEEEYNRRLEAEKTLCKFLGKELLVAPYESEKYHEYVKGLENEPERGNRCMVCYNLRMEKTAKMAKECNYDYFCTTLSVSPYKNSEWINKIGEKLQNKYNIRIKGGEIYFRPLKFNKYWEKLFICKK